MDRSAFDLTDPDAVPGRPVIVEERAPEALTAAPVMARIGYELAEVGDFLPLDLDFLQRRFSGFDAVHIETTVGEIWTYRWIGSAHEPRLSLARGNGWQAESHPLRVSLDPKVGAKNVIMNGSVTRLLVTTRQWVSRSDALTYTNGRYSDLRTRHQLARAAGTRDGIGAAVVALAPSSSGRALYAQDLALLEAASPEAPHAGVGLAGQFPYAVVQIEPAVGDRHHRSRWEVISPRHRNLLPLRVGSSFDPAVGPRSGIVTRIYGVIDPERLPGVAPMSHQPIEAARFPTWITGRSGARSDRAPGNVASSRTLGR